MIIEQLLTAMIGVGKWLLHNQRNVLEFSLVVASIFTHVLEARQNIWSKILAFPIAFMNIYVYSVRRLYGKVVYSIIFIFFNLYAYLRWKGTTHRKPVKVSRTSYKVFLSITGMSILGGMVWRFVVGRYFNISSYGDDCYLAFGFMDKWLMSHKKLERWMIALFRYIVFSLACYQKGAIMLSIHYLILSCIGVYGQIKWYLSYKTMKAS
ncbi:MAG: nicotinamide mononucleotide transporter family protein [Candidatus Cardinium sp.]|uniref:nicotinamide mononucleotide transporter family protein n=1 Tax=Candidatus Cardinium sp. TP TaxID=2961955 RepID=UPI0021B07632|nr:nicotinamide mononucleotide transporter family protein [Candidatus Cardinium sp. TP]MCT4697287.1 nicotinamide mononucleotide transporter family protein [Candidatus Cardinium sp. TP]MDN5247048.1 nicotinamide mononucleotide transporter family protein [Candidatus Cardinium sp.]